MNAELRSALFRVLPFVVAGIVLLVLITRKKIDRGAIELVRPSSWVRVLLWLSGFLVYILIEESIAFKAGFLVPDPWHYGPLATVIRVTGILLLAPVVEEILFRGLILNVLLKRKLGFAAAAFIQALFFMLSHSTFYDVNSSTAYYFIWGLADGMLYAYARRHTGSLYTPMLMHMSGNAVATLERFII